MGLIGKIFNVDNDELNKHLKLKNRIPNKGNHDVVVIKKVPYKDKYSVKTITSLEHFNRKIRKFQYDNKALHQAKQGIINPISINIFKTKNWSGIHNKSINNISSKHLKSRKYTKRKSIPKEYKYILKK